MQEEKSLNELIIEKAVEELKDGNIKNSLDVENFIDSLLQPLMQKLLDTELENHLEYSKMEVVFGLVEQSITYLMLKTI